MAKRNQLRYPSKCSESSEQKTEELDLWLHWCQGQETRGTKRAGQSWHTQIPGSILQLELILGLEPLPITEWSNPAAPYSFAKRGRRYGMFTVHAVEPLGKKIKNKNGISVGILWTTWGPRPGAAFNLGVPELESLTHTNTNVLPTKFCPLIRGSL